MARLVLLGCRARAWVGVPLAAASFLMCAVPHLAAQSPALPLAPCQLAGVPESVYCGTYQVWEDRETRKGRQIALRVVFVPARASDSAPVPVLVLQGGPGSSNVASAVGMARSPLRERRAVLLIDVRGTGQSGPLGCDLGPGEAGVRSDFLPLDRVRACRDSLASLTDLSKYTAPIVADDIAEVIRALGIRQVNLRGFSGGTRQALELIRRHPDMVRSAILEGPVPMDARVPLTFARDAQAALDGVLEDCAAEQPCAAAFPAPGLALQRTLQRLSTAPETVTVPLPQGAGTVEVAVTASGVAQVIRSMLYQPGPTRLLPLALSRAAEGDWTLWGERLRTLGVPPGIAIGFYLSATCAEDVPWFNEEEAAALAESTYLGLYRVQQQKAACAVWPRGELPPTHLRPVRSNLPVLLLVGQHDPVTPPRWGTEVAQHLPRSRLVVVPGGGHGFAGLESVECLDSVRIEFITELAPERLDLTCLATVRRPPFHLAPPN